VVAAVRVPVVRVPVVRVPVVRVPVVQVVARWMTQNIVHQQHQLTFHCFMP
jgi:hypothetical protein